MSSPTVTPRLLGVPESNVVWSVRIALAEKGVPVAHVPADPHSPDVRAIHPLGKIPVFEHGSVRLAESRAICAYVDQAFEGPPLVPAGLVERATVEQWVSMALTDLDPVAVRRFLFLYLFPADPAAGPDPAAIAAALPTVRGRLLAWDAAVAAHGGYVAAPAWTLADAYATPIIAYLRNLPEGPALFEATPALRGWFERVSARPSFATTLPELAKPR
jgi:glutathione S-transferase